MEKLKKQFEAIGFSGDELNQVLAAFTLKTFAKNDFFTEDGKISRHLGFIEKGLFQYMLQQIPLQHLASMLGVTPRHLSRIRKNIR